MSDLIPILHNKLLLSFSRAHSCCLESLAKGCDKYLTFDCVFFMGDKSNDDECFDDYILKRSRTQTSESKQQQHRFACLVLSHKHCLSKQDGHT